MSTIVFNCKSLKNYNIPKKLTFKLNKHEYTGLEKPLQIFKKALTENNLDLKDLEDRLSFQKKEEKVTPKNSKNKYLKTQLSYSVSVSNPPLEKAESIEDKITDIDKNQPNHLENLQKKLIVLVNLEKQPCPSEPIAMQTDEEKEENSGIETFSIHSKKLEYVEYPEHIEPVIVPSTVDPRKALPIKKRRALLVSIIGLLIIGTLGYRYLKRKPTKPLKIDKLGSLDPIGTKV